MYIDSSKYSVTKNSTEDNVSTTIEIVEIENGYIYQVTTRNVSTGNEMMSSEKENRQVKTYYSKEKIDEDAIDDKEEEKEESITESLSKAMGKIV